MNLLCLIAKTKPRMTLIFGKELAMKVSLSEMIPEEYTAKTENSSLILELKVPRKTSEKESKVGRISRKGFLFLGGLTFLGIFGYLVLETMFNQTPWEKQMKDLWVPLFWGSLFFTLAKIWKKIIGALFLAICFTQVFLSTEQEFWQEFVQVFQGIPHELWFLFLTMVFLYLYFRRYKPSLKITLSPEKIKLARNNTLWGISHYYFHERNLSSFHISAISTRNGSCAFLWLQDSSFKKYLILSFVGGTRKELCQRATSLALYFQSWLKIPITGKKDIETENTVLRERKESAICENWKPQLDALLKENEKLLFWKENGKVQYLILDIQNQI